MSGLLDYYITEGYTTPEAADPPTPTDYFTRSEDTEYVDSDYWANGYTPRTLSAISDNTILSTMVVFGRAIVDRPPIGRRLLGSANITDAATISVFGVGKLVGETQLNITVGVISSGSSLRVGSSLHTVISSNNTSAQRTRSSGVQTTIISGFTCAAIANKTCAGQLNIITGVSSSGGRLRVSSSSTFNNTLLNGSSSRTRYNSATLLHNGEEVTWENMNSWGEPTQEAWLKRFSVSAVRKVVATALPVEINSTLNSSSGRIRQFSSTCAATSTSSISSNRRLAGSATVNIITALASEGTNAIKGTANFSGVVTLSSVGRAVFFGKSLQTIAATLNSSSGRQRKGSSETPAITTSITISGGRIKRTSTSVDIVTLTSVAGNASSRSGATLNNTVGFSSASSRTRGVIGKLNIAVGARGLGGKRLGAFDVRCGIVVTQNSAGRKFTIEPFRTIRVLPESRTRVANQETRRINTINQTRINIVATHYSSITVLQETRQYRIAHGTLVTRTTLPFKQERE